MSNGPIKIALVYNSELYDKSVIEKLNDDIQVAFNKADLIPPNTNHIILEGEPNAVILLEFPKSAMHEDVVEIADILAQKTDWYKEYWLLTDEVEDHPEIYRSE